MRVGVIKGEKGKTLGKKDWKGLYYGKDVHIISMKNKVKALDK